MQAIIIVAYSLKFNHMLRETTFQVFLSQPMVSIVMLSSTSLKFVIPLISLKTLLIYAVFYEALLTHIVFCEGLLTHVVL